MELAQEIVTQSMKVVSYVLPIVFLIGIIGIADRIVAFIYKVLQTKRVRW